MARGTLATYTFTHVLKGGRVQIMKAKDLPTGKIQFGIHQVNDFDELMVLLESRNLNKLILQSIHHE